jgi:hypothetical protein
MTVLIGKVNTADENGDSIMSSNSFPLAGLVSYQLLPFNHWRYLDILYTYIMSLHDDSTNDFDPYFGLDITWRDSPLSEWLRPPAIDQMEEAAAADMATPIGRYLSVVGQGEISCRL